MRIFSKVAGIGVCRMMFVILIVLFSIPVYADLTYDLTYSLDPTQASTNIVFGAGFTLSPPPFQDNIVSFTGNSAPAGPVGPITTNISIGGTFDLVSGQITLIGEYDNDGVTGLGFVMNKTTGDTLIADGTSFASAFAGGFTEDQLITAINNQDTTTVKTFFADNLSDWISYTLGSTDLSGDIVLFSNATNGGTFTIDSVEATPEPSLVLIVGAVCVIMTFFRRKTVEH